MRTHRWATALFLFFFGGLFLVQAQTNAPTNPQAARELRMISFLTPAEQEQYAKARAKALADNPAIKSEGEDLIQQAEGVMSTGTMADKQAFMEKMSSHRQKLRQAMLKEDPTLEPIFAQIDQHLSQLRARQAAAAPPASH